MLISNSYKCCLKNQCLKGVIMILRKTILIFMRVHLCPYELQISWQMCFLSGGSVLKLYNTTNTHNRIKFSREVKMIIVVDKRLHSNNRKTRIIFMLDVKGELSRRFALSICLPRVFESQSKSGPWKIILHWSKIKLKWYFSLFLYNTSTKSNH